MSNAESAERVIDADYVNIRLDEAGATLLSLPGSGFSSRLSSGGLDVVRNAIEAYGWTDLPIRPSVPSAAKIDEMDKALAWLSLIPQSSYILRRIVGARMMVHPVTERRLFTWNRIAKSIGSDHKAVQRWHGTGIDLIVRALHRQNNFESPFQHAQQMCH